MDVHFLSLGGYVFPRAAFGLPLTLNCVSEQATLEFDVFGKSKRARWMLTFFRFGALKNGFDLPLACLAKSATNCNRGKLDNYKRNLIFRPFFTIFWQTHTLKGFIQPRKIGHFFMKSIDCQQNPNLWEKLSLFRRVRKAANFFALYLPSFGGTHCTKFYGNIKARICVMIMVTLGLAKFGHLSKKMSK